MFSNFNCSAPKITICFQPQHRFKKNKKQKTKNPKQNKQKPHKINTQMKQFQPKQLRIAKRLLTCGITSSAYAILQILVGWKA